MGIDFVAASLILHEHKYKPITGNVLTIGRQSIGFDAEQLKELLIQMDVPLRKNWKPEKEKSTVGVPESHLQLSQESFFSSFTDVKVLSLDVSAYEKADVVCDLQGEVPSEYDSIADFIYNGSCLDNIFDAAAAMRNMSKLLKPNGRIHHYEQGNSHPTAYLKYSPDWFMDYYAMNKFEDCKTYVVNKPNSANRPLIPSPYTFIGTPLPSKFPYDLIVYNYNPCVFNAGGPGYDCSSIEAQTRYEIHCIAEKKEDSTTHRMPIQKHYRVDQWHQNICLQSVQRFFNSSRPLFKNNKKFEISLIPRIDSSDYPEQFKICAII